MSECKHGAPEWLGCEECNKEVDDSEFEKELEDAEEDSKLTEETK